VKIAEKEREGLEGEKIAAEAYLYKDAERLGTQSKIFQRFMHDGQVCQWISWLGAYHTVHVIVRLRRAKVRSPESFELHAKLWPAATRLFVTSNLTMFCTTPSM